MTHRDPLFPRPRRSGSFWYRTGVPGGRRRVFDVAVTSLVGLFAVGWGLGIAEVASDVSDPNSLSRRLTENPLSSGGVPEAAFVLDALVRTFTETDPLRGESGALRVLIPEPGEAPPIGLDSVPEGVDVVLEPRTGEGPDVPLEPAPDSAATPVSGGSWRVALRSGAVRRILPDLTILTQIPLSEKRQGRIGSYIIGDWPFEDGGTPPSEAYETPRGVVEVTPENVDLPVSEHFVLGDLLTKGQNDVWPKYVVLSTRLLDKLELTLQELERMGHPVENAGVISGFRTPSYNAHGGNTSGRGSLSRHMYGDAMDFFIDNDGDGRMDDLNGDGRVDVGDARVLARAADRVEARFPHLVGGIGTYSPTGAHAGFVHVDTRGYRARW